VAREGRRGEHPVSGRISGSIKSEAVSAGRAIGDQVWEIGKE
jgi:hypothetical protein